MRIKSVIKRFLDQKIGKKELNKDSIDITTPYVSFDIFDTLIVRNLPTPTALFRLIEERQGIPDFYNKRIRAEREARRKKQGEVTIEEIYRCFPDISFEQISTYCQMELEYEMQVCVPNERLIAFYRDCVKKKRVVLLSDMYLTSEIMEKILRHCGISGYEKMYISCEMMVSKRSGAMFAEVLHDLGIANNQIIHVGNDFMSDYYMAKKQGIQTIKIRSPKQ